MPGKTSCETILPLLSVYVDKEATAAEAEQIEAHLPHCVRCASQLAFLRLAHESLSRPSIAAVPQSLHERIAVATYARPTFQDRVAAWLRPAPARLALGGAAMAAVLAVAVLVRSPGGPVPTGGQVANQPDLPPASAPSTSRPSASSRVDPSVPGKRTDVAVNKPGPERSAPAAVAKTSDEKPSSAQVAAPKTRLPAGPAKPAEPVTPQVARNEASPSVKRPKPSHPLVIAKVTPAPAPPAATPRRVETATTRRQPVKDTTPSAPEPKTPDTPEVTPSVVAAATPEPKAPAVSVADAEPERGALTADGRIRRRVDRSAMAGVVAVRDDSRSGRRNSTMSFPELGHSPGGEASVNKLPVY